MDSSELATLAAVIYNAATEDRANNVYKKPFANLERAEKEHWYAVARHAATYMINGVARREMESLGRAHGSLTAGDVATGGIVGEGGYVVGEVNGRSAFRIMCEGPGSERVEIPDGTTITINVSNTADFEEVARKVREVIAKESAKVPGMLRSHRRVTGMQ